MFILFTQAVGGLVTSARTSHLMTTHRWLC